ncbi:MAG: EamA family transporter [Microbacteriaceae bacterium]|nr:EamA family transporter [Microbacteriaceae bacterium]
MLPVVVGFGSALVFGTADFLGGLATKRIGAILSTAIAAAIGILLFLLLALALPGVWSWDAVGWGALSGVFGAAALGLLYACLAIGPMSILSPLTALVSAVVPLVWAVVGGERIGLLGWFGLAIGLVAVGLVGFVPEQGVVRPSVRAVLMAVGSGIMIGANLIAIDRAPDDSGLIPMVANRVANASIMFTIAGVLAVIWLVRRSRARSQHPPGATPLRRPRGVLRAGLRLAIVCGVVDAIANGSMLWGVRIGDLSVMAVLIALYPIGTILLARIVLKERIAPVQYAGLALAIAASALLALD